MLKYIQAALFPAFRKEEYIVAGKAKRKDNNRMVLKTGESQRKDGTYSYRWTDKMGKRHSAYAKNLIELREKEKQILKDLEKGIYCVNPNMTLDDYFSEWLSVKKGIRDSTASVYNNLYKIHISPRLGFRPISAITLTDLKRFYIDLVEGGTLKGKSITFIHTLLSQILESAKEDYLISNNPCKRAYKEISHMIEPASPKNALTKEEESAFFKFISASKVYSKWQNLFLFIVGTGLRAGEAFAITWDDVDFENGTISVNKTSKYYKGISEESFSFHCSPPKTKSSIRSVPMSNSVKEILAYEKRKQAESKIDCNGLCFSSRNHGPLNIDLVDRSLKRVINKYNESPEAEKSGVLLPHFSMHTFRHTFATRMFESGVDPRITQAILGHSSLNMTLNVYTDISDELRQKGISELDKHLAEFTPKFTPIEA